MSAPSPSIGEYAQDLPTLRLVNSTTRGARMGAWLLLWVLLFTLVSLVFVPWQQNITGHGRVIAYAPLERQQPVEAPLAGRIIRWAVMEGSRVKAGDLIAELNDNDPSFMERLAEQRTAIEARMAAATSQMEAYESRVDALRASQAANVSAADSRVQMMQERLRSNEQSLAAAEANFETARLNLDRQKSLLAEGLTSQRNWELAQLDYARAETGLESARAAVAASQNELKAAQADRQRIQTDADALINDGLAKYEYAKADVAKEKIELAKLQVNVARQTTQEVRAPRDGTILRLLAREGTEQVKAGDAIAILVPDTSSRAVELWVDGNDAPLIEEGRHVRLQFEGWPAVQFSGWPSVAVGTFGGKVAFVDAADNGKGAFRIVVVPEREEDWPSSRFLRQGVRTNGWVLLNWVSLGYELWRQFNGFPPVVSNSKYEPGWYDKQEYEDWDKGGKGGKGKAKDEDEKKDDEKK